MRHAQAGMSVSGEVGSFSAVSACHTLFHLALDKCVVTQGADCARVLRLYRRHGCHVHSAAGAAATPMDFMSARPGATALGNHDSVSQG